MEHALPIYEFTTQLASFAPPKIEEQWLFESLAGKQDAINQFFGALIGAVPLKGFFAPENLFKIMGVRRMSKIMLHNLLKPKIRAGQPQATQSSVTTG